MNPVKYILFLFAILFSSCIGQMVYDVKKTYEIVDEMERYSQSEEALTKRERLINEKTLTLQYSDKIESSENSELINYRDLVLRLCETLLNNLEGSIQLIRQKHGTDPDGNLNDRWSSFHVNKIFIEDGRGKMIKLSIGQTIDQLIEGAMDIEIDLTADELPLKLNLFMEEEGKTWEEYFFKDMPAIATIPIFGKFKQDVTLTKLDLLERLASTVDSE